MILPLACHSAQNAADSAGRLSSRFATRPSFGYLKAKIETCRKGLIDFYHDPSLWGRIGQSPVQPPRLFGLNSQTACGQRRTAHRDAAQCAACAQPCAQAGLPNIFQKVAALRSRLSGFDLTVSCMPHDLVILHVPERVAPPGPR